MGNGPVSLNEWTSSRPVKLAERKNEDAYSSRQERTKVTLRLPSQVADQLKVWCATTKQHAQDLVAELLVSHFRMDGQTATDQIRKIDDENKNQLSNRTLSSSPCGRPDGQSQVEREALLLYSQLTGNKVLPRDHSAFAAVAHFPSHVILSGIITSYLRAENQIRSFRYCTGAIEEMSDPEVTPSYVEYLKDFLRRHPKEKQPNLPSVGGDVLEIAAQGPSDL